jgi:UDPglucose 6-dehydrogenase
LQDKKLKKITIVGLGYVGLTTALGFAKLGHSVIGVENNVAKLAKLQSGEMTIFEQNLDLELKKSLDSGLLKLSSSIEVAASESDIFFICVSTPQDSSGSADLAFVISACREVGAFAPESSVIVLKSTVPVGTGEKVASLVGRGDIKYASNPEFLREGSALQDFMTPDRIVVGSEDAGTSSRIIALYEKIESLKIETSTKSAELIKYAANSYLAARLSFVNEMASLCEEVGASVDDVMAGMGSDNRIGSSFLSPGPGWGGSCFPKDTKALLSFANNRGVDLRTVSAAIESNEESFARVVSKLKSLLGGQLSGKSICALGLSFKANTDDTRDSPSMEIIRRLIAEGCSVRGYDPASLVLPIEGFYQFETALEAASGSDALVVLTEWSEFEDLDPEPFAKSMKGSIVFDTRRVFRKEAWREVFEVFEVLGERSH